jgi:hypothetical protein
MVAPHIIARRLLSFGYDPNKACSIRKDILITPWTFCLQEKLEYSQVEAANITRVFLEATQYPLPKNDILGWADNMAIYGQSAEEMDQLSEQLGRIQQLLKERRKVCFEMERRKVCVVMERK